MNPPPIGALGTQGFSSAAGIWLSVRQTLVSAGRFVQLLERRPEVRPNEGRTPAQCHGHLTVHNVSFHYPASAETRVLSGVSLDAPPGSIVALVGASGAGKSTIARLIERFYDPTGGALLLDGVDFRQLELRWLRRQIGFVEQVRRVPQLECTFAWTHFSPQRLCSTRRHTSTERLASAPHGA